MPQKRRLFRRQAGQRPYRKLFIISAEGEVTEPEYFELFNKRKDVTIHVKCLKRKHSSSPEKILNKLKKKLKNDDGFRKGDEAWLVLDKDSWTDEQLNSLFAWSESEAAYGFALSNPKFEFWLLLHFEEGKDVKSSRHCTERLKRYLPNFDKHIERKAFSGEKIRDAVRRARDKDSGSGKPWPDKNGSTVYLLVEKLLEGLGE